MKLVVVISIGVLLASCDPLRGVSVSRPITDRMEQSCVLDALRVPGTVRTIEIPRPEQVYVELIVPNDLEHPEGRQGITAQESVKDGEVEFSLAVVWVGYAGSSEYREWVEEVAEDLATRVVDRCGS